MGGCVGLNTGGFAVGGCVGKCRGGGGKAVGNRTGVEVGGCIGGCVGKRVGTCNKVNYQVWTSVWIPALVDYQETYTLSRFLF